MIDSRYKYKHGKEVEEEAGSTISNITQIANRSYYDLQDLPLSYLKNSGADDYIAQAGDTSCYLALGKDLILPEGVFNESDELRGFFGGIGDFSEITATNGLVLCPTGKLPRVVNGGFFNLIKGVGNAWYLSGDLVEEYAIRQSPNGNLWKVSVDNSGNEVITAL